MKAGEFHGDGVKQWSDSSRYEGEWQADQRAGMGVLTWADGQHYEGTFGGDSELLAGATSPAARTAAKAAQAASKTAALAAKGANTVAKEAKARAEQAEQAAVKAKEIATAATAAAGRGKDAAVRAQALADEANRLPKPIMTVVARVQKGLARAGYPVGSPDGLVGPKTLAAMLRFLGTATVPEGGWNLTELGAELEKSAR